MTLPYERMKKAFWAVSLEEDDASVSAELAAVPEPPSEFVICACLLQRGKTVAARFCSSNEPNGGMDLSLSKAYIGEPAVLKLFTWDNTNSMRPLDSVFEFSK